jgi:hypothetical protein
MPKDEPPPKPVDAREAKLAQALRANLRRRKVGPVSSVAAKPQKQT